MSIVSKINLLQDNAGTPGEALTSTQLASGTTFWVEIQLQDLDINPSGIVASLLNLKWDPNSLTATSLTVTNGLPLLRSENITTGNAQVGGGSTPELGIGKAIGKDKLERFALVRLTTKSNLNATSSLFTIVADPTGFSTGGGTKILNGSPLIALVNPITTIPENTSTSTPVKVANLSITDDIFGNNIISLSGSDASSFEIKGNELYLKAGTNLNYNTKSSYSVILSVNDANINKGDSKTFNLSITPVTLPTLSIETTNATQREGNTGTKAFTFTVTRSGDTNSSYTDINPTLATATNLGVINERTLSILTSPDTSSFSVGTDPGSNSLVPADVDMYRFELGQAGTISLETSLPQNGAGMDTILRLFDIYGKELGGDDDTGPDFYSRLNAYLKAGTYYFAVSGYANFSYSLTSANSGVEGTSGDYAIKVAFNPNATPFVGDPNGTATGARDIGNLSNFTTAGSADAPSIIGLDTDLPGVDPTPENMIAVGDKDVDLIKFTVNPGLVVFQTSNYVPNYIEKFGQIRGKAYLDLLDSDRDGSFDDPIDTVLRLFDASGNELTIDDDGGEGLLSRLEYVFTTAGTYYLGVSGYGNSTYNINTLPDAVDNDSSRRSGSTGSSLLSIILQPNTAPQDPNGVFYGAIPVDLLYGSNLTLSEQIGTDILADTTISVTGGDVDLYRFVANESGVVLIDLDTATGNSLNTYLRTFDGNGIALPSPYFNDDSTAQGFNRDSLTELGNNSTDSFVRLDVTAGSTYYISVSASGNQTYDLNNLDERTNPSTGDYQINLQYGGGATTATDADGYIHANLPSFNLTQTNTGSSNLISLQRNIGNDDQAVVGATDVDFVKVNFQGTGTTPRILTSTARGIGTGKSALMPRVYVFNGQGDRLSAVTSSSSPNTIQISLNPDTNYYVGVAGYGNKNFNPLIMGSGTSAETGNYTLNLSLSGSGANWAVTGSSTNQADATDFGGTLPTGTVSFAAGETSQTITVNVSGDTTVEPDEGFIVTLSNPSGATISTATATGTIQNDDAALAIASTNVNQIEGNSGTKAFTFTVTRNGDTTSSSSANWSVTESGTNPANGADFVGGTLPTGTVNFTAGETSKSITVNVLGDTTVEPDEGFTVTLSNPTNANITTGTATGTITNDDTQVTLAVSPTSVTEDGTSNLIYTFTRTGVISNSLTANYTIGGTATNGNDYSNIGTSVIFAAGSSTATVTVDPTSDTTGENDETIILTLASGTGYNIGTSGAVTGTITNDDSFTDYSNDPLNPTVVSGGDPNLTIRNTVGGSDVTDYVRFVVPEGNILTSIQLTSYSSNDTRAFIALQKGEAFTAVPVGGTLPGALGFTHFGTGVVDASVGSNLLSKLGGTQTSGPYSLWIQQLGSQSEYAITVSWLDNGPLPTITLSASPDSVTEDGTSNLIYTFTRTGSTTNTLAVNYTIGGTATNGSDYNNIGTSVTFTAGSSTATVTVDPTSDTTVENDETLILTLASGTGYTIGTTSGVTGTITNDDTQVTLAVSPTSVTEDGTNNLVYTFTRTGVISNSLTVNYTIGGTATNSIDYTSV
ncbi:beta strand repeat-containing protein, partial [Cylindrospermopsis raciborskii]|uniref:beta strand repeat-containing protein n=1 Tax=Cylindrospermopsis raciborskii TaxID=77022 RepID=UPI0038D0D26C